VPSDTNDDVLDKALERARLIQRLREKSEGFRAAEAGRLRMVKNMTLVCPQQSLNLQNQSIERFKGELDG